MDYFMEKQGKDVVLDPPIIKFATQLDSEKSTYLFSYIINSL